MCADTICGIRVQHVVPPQYSVRSIYLLYLREARIPIDLAMKTIGEAVPAEWDDYVTEVRSTMKKTFQTVRDQLGHAFQRAKQV